MESKKNKKEKKKRKKETEPCNKSGETISCEDSCPTIRLEEKQDLRQKLEENSEKFSHLPVYDPALEARKTEERRREMTAIFTDLDKQLGTVRDLTTSHMEKQGIQLKTSRTPFDEEQQPPAQPSHSAHPSQGDSASPASPDTKDKTETYESLGETFRQLTDKMETVTKDLKSDQIPYADDEDDYEDYLVTTEVSDDPTEHDNLDEAIEEALSGFLDTKMSVERIQLQSSPSVSSTSLVVSERKFQGTDTIHLRRKTIRRDFTDI